MFLNMCRYISACEFNLHNYSSFQTQSNSGYFFDLFENTEILHRRKEQSNESKNKLQVY